METKTVYDIIGIGIGPFNLGLAALADSMPELNCLFVDQNQEFNWHQGLMLPNARLQVPFYADLVTLADPRSKYNYMCFLKAKSRTYRFAILENNFILRREYNEYCRWVAEQLNSLVFGLRCEEIHYDENEKVYSVHVRNISNDEVNILKTKHIVIGVGTVPYVPDLTPALPKGRDKFSTGGEGESLKQMLSSRSLEAPPFDLAQGRLSGPLVFHSSDYLYFKERLLTKKSISIIGSGQSAAEIFYDLLTGPPPNLPPVEGGLKSRELSWFTRGEFSPMDYSSFALEKTSPDYIDHFYGLSFAKKKETLRSQNHLYKGINSSLINDIYNELYQQHLSEPTNHVNLYSNCELQHLNKKPNDEIELSFYHSETEQVFTQCSEAVVLATGYENKLPNIIKPIKELIQWLPEAYGLGRDSSLHSPRKAGHGGPPQMRDMQAAQAQYHVNRNYSIDKCNSIFIQNAELQTHGFNAPDLGMGPYRNATILNSILGYEHFIMEKNIAFQKFGGPTGF